MSTRNVSHDDDSVWPIDALVFVSAGVVCCVDLVLDYYYYFVTKHCHCWTKNAFFDPEEDAEEIGNVVWIDGGDGLLEEANHGGHSSESDLVFESADRQQYLRHNRVSDAMTVVCWRTIFPVNHVAVVVVVAADRRGEWEDGVNHDAVVVVVAADRRGEWEDGDGWCADRYLLLVGSDLPVPSWNLAGTLSLSVTHPLFHQLVAERKKHEK
jgi:hypothetical protein